MRITLKKWLAAILVMPSLAHNAQAAGKEPDHRLSTDHLQGGGIGNNRYVDPFIGTWGLDSQAISPAWGFRSQENPSKN